MRVAFALAAVGLCACSADGGPGSPTGPTPPAAVAHDPEDAFFAALPTGEQQLRVVCGRGSRDAVAVGLCARPRVGGLADLQRAVGLFSQPQPPQFALTGHSTSLVERNVSAINPRAIVFTAPTQQPTTQPNDGSFVADPGFVAMGFVRGEQLVELAAHDADANQLHFYLVRFRQDCNGAGCTPGDLLTPAIESDWRSLTVYEDEDLKNTVFDCLQCHQPDGPGSTKMLRMQERRAPWTHWFRNNQNQPGGEALLADFQAAHGTGEDYAAIPAALLDTPRSDPLVLEALLDNNTVSPQPNEFPTAKIEQQVEASAPAQPADNMPMGQSSAWQQIYDVAAQGQAIPVPYHDVKITDPDKLAQMTQAYRAFVDGTLPASELPDIRQVLLDAALPDLGLRPRAGADGRAILTQMCQRCHNDKLDQTLSRARFDVTRLDALPRDEKDLAIARLQQAGDSPQLMPPARFGSLSADELAAAIAVLRN